MNLKTVLILPAIALVFLLVVEVVDAVPPTQSATLSTPGTSRTLTLPPAADNSTVISLGTAVDPGTGKKVDGIAIIHKKNPAKGGQEGSKSTTCYGYLARGAKWKTLENWMVNPTNSRGLDSTASFNLLDGGVTKWETAAGADILGSGSTTLDSLVADLSSPDNQNEVYFADISDSNTIAVTIVWGIFSGPTFGRELVEWDQVYDDVTFDWSLSGEAGKMDFDNIATHELGHSVGMADLYNSCTEETMYGYSTTGETKKRDLNSGDIAGINALY